MLDPISLSLPGRRAAIEELSGFSHRPATGHPVRLVYAVLLLAGLLWLASSALAAPQIEIEGLFTDAAVLRIDGERKMLKVGQSFRGVTLLSAYSETATLEYEGEEMVLGLSRRVGANYREPVIRQVTIQRDANLQYQTTASINGRQVKVMVDTGANVVAMNSAHAQSVGVDAKAGQLATVHTAGGTVEARAVQLRSIDVGGIRINNVEATVLQGSHPSVILLGMSYLQHVKISEQGGIMTLSATP